MTPQNLLYALIVAAYFIGSIPFGLIVARTRGIDPRTAGSGNIGATNVGRLLGGKFFAIVFILDMCKSMIPMLVASAIVHQIAPESRDRSIHLLWILVGFAAFIGHVYPIYLKFKGGKGVATAAGILLGLWPYFTIPGVVALTVFFITFRMTRVVSLGSIVGSISFPILYVIVGLWKKWDVFGRQLPLLVVAVILASMIILKHRSNIARLLSGTEHAFKKA